MKRNCMFAAEHPEKPCGSRRLMILLVALVMAAAMLAAPGVVPVARAQACCQITGISGNMASARVTRTGATFQFTLTQPVSLRVGDAVFANFPKREVSCNGRSICGTITSLSPVLAPTPGTASGIPAKPQAAASAAAGGGAPGGMAGTEMANTGLAPAATRITVVPPSGTSGGIAPLTPAAAPTPQLPSTAQPVAAGAAPLTPATAPTPQLPSTAQPVAAGAAPLTPATTPTPQLPSTAQPVAAGAAPLTPATAPTPQLPSTAQPLAGGAALPSSGSSLRTSSSSPYLGALQSSPACQPWPPAWPSQYQGTMCRSANPSKPAILLFHGLGNTFQAWTKPSSVGFNYDYSHSPGGVDLGSHGGPNAGIYKVGTSNMLDVDSLNWFDYLVQQGFTVAAWTQPAGTFATAYPSAQAALTQFANDTAAMNSASPPPIVLIGHSRGGLLIHQLLRDPTMANLVSRIRWVITVHTPHHGSEVAETPQILAQETAGLFAALDLPADVVRALEGLAQQTLSPLNQLIYQNEKELAPNSQLIQGLLTNDTPVPGVKYYTFGGTSPMAVRLYTWLFTPGSALPQAKDLEVYFNWQANPAEVGPVSPLLNRVPPAMPEITPGQGDILVSDQSARLPYSIHQTDQLNHVEVLWNRALQQQVASILSAPLVPTLPQFPAKVSASGARPSR